MTAIRTELETAAQKVKEQKEAKSMTSNNADSGGAAVALL